ncbi:unnamed protein product, partial [Discosporangium mesarthrocarpum]
QLLETCLGSSTAGFVARVFCHPLDTSKARLQGPNGQGFRNTLHVLRVTLAEEGVWGLYRGFVAVAVGGTPGTCIYLTTYEVAKNMLEADAGTGQFGVHFTAGMVAETICCVVYVPVDVVKERLQVQRSASSTGGLPQYTGTRNALGSILRTEGLWGIYKGYGATLASFGPFSALYFTFYEQAKATSQQLWEKRMPPWALGSKQACAVRKGFISTGEEGEGNGVELPFWVTLANAAGAGSLASWITSPLDMAKLRLQVQRASSSAAVTADTTHQYTGMANVLARTYRLEGVRGLFRGAGARVWFHAPSTAITMATFEQAKRWWGALLGPQPGN